MNILPLHPVKAEHNLVGTCPFQTRYRRVLLEGEGVP